jgi:hypothetical protein
VEPDLDRGDVDGAAVDVVAFVVAGGHGSVALELVDAAFDGVALFVALGVEFGWPPAVAAAVAPVVLLVGRFEAALQILDLLDSGNPAAQLIREKLTVVVIPMYNPDGAEANIRQSTTPNRIDLNRDWENFAQPESIAFWRLWRDVAPALALDLHHMGQAPIVEDTDDLNQFQIGARSIDPSRMTDLQWLTNRQMAMVSVDALDRHGLANVAHYPLIDITNAALSRMLMGGTAPAGEQPVMQTPTQDAVFYEVRSVGQKSNGQLENLFRIPTMAVLAAAADGSLSSYDISGYTSLPFASQGPCGQ